MNRERKQEYPSSEPLTAERKEEKLSAPPRVAASAVPPVAVAPASAEDIRWLEAARTGDAKALHAALSHDPPQLIDQVVEGQTALQAVIMGGHLACVELLMEKGADPGILTSRGTALITAIDKCDAEAYKIMLAKLAGQRALNQVHIARNIALQSTGRYDSSEACYTPLTYACAQYEKARSEADKMSLSSIIEQSLQARTPLWPAVKRASDQLRDVKERKQAEPSRIVVTDSHQPVSLTAVRDFYSLHFSEKNPGYNRGLRHYGLARLTAQSLRELFINLGDRAPAVLISALMNLDARQDRQDLPEGWQHEAFLTLRIQGLFTLWQDVSHGSRKEVSEVGLTCEVICQHLAQEIAINLEMLRTAQEIRTLPRALAGDCYPIIAERIAANIQKLPDGAEYAFATGWEGHAVYMSWMRCGDQILWRVDNLNEAEAAYHRPDHPATADNQPHPAALIGQCAIIDFREAAYKEHLTELVRCFHQSFKTSRDEGVDLLYKAKTPQQQLKLTAISKDHAVRQRLPFLPLQAKSNCYAKNHEPGFHTRLGNQKLIDYVQLHERQCALRWAAEASDPLGLSLRESYQLEISQQLPDYLLTHLHGRYQQQSRIKRLFADEKDVGQPIAESYINLSIVVHEDKRDVRAGDAKEEKEAKESKGAKVGQDAKRRLPPRELLSSSRQDLQGLKTKPVAVDKLWEQAPSSASQHHVVLSGRAGIGKSTFCQYIAYQWSQRQLWPTIPQLFWIRLRELKRYAEQTNGLIDLVDVIEAHCLPKSLKLNPGQRALLQRKIAQGQALWLLDGYDELAETLYAHPERPLRKLMSTLWQQPWVLLTSRPHAVSNIRQHLPQAVLLEVTGFTDEQVTHYIKKFFSAADGEAAGTLERFLKQQTNIWGLAHVPINLELICSVWKQGGLKSGALSLTQLYQELTQGLLWRDAYRRSQLYLGESSLSSAYEAEQTFLAELAFVGMRDQRLTFPEQEVARVLANHHSHIGERQKCRERALSLGVLRRNHSTRFASLSDTYEFIHLTFQEYYAARYIAQAYSQNPKSEIHQDILDFTAQHKYNPRYQIMWWFVAGVLSLESEYLQRFFDQLLREPREIVPSTEWGLWLRCLDEANIPESWPYTHKILQALGEWNLWMVENYITEIRAWSGSSHDNFTSHNWWDLLKSSFKLSKHPTIHQPVLRCLQKEKIRRKALHFLEEYLPDETLLAQAVEAVVAIIPVVEKDMACNPLLRGLINQALMVGHIPCLKVLMTALGESNKYIQASVTHALLDSIQTPSINQEELLDLLLFTLNSENNHQAGVAVLMLVKWINFLPEEYQLKVTKKLSAHLQKVVHDIIFILSVYHNYKLELTVTEALTFLIKKLPEKKRALIVSSLLSAARNDDLRGKKIVRILGIIAVQLPSDQQLKVINFFQATLSSLKERDQNMRAQAVTALGGSLRHLSGVIQIKAVESLLSRLDDKDQNVREQASTVLGWSLRDLSGVIQIKAVESLLSRLDDKDRDVRAQAVTALGGSLQYLSGVIQIKAVESLLSRLDEEYGFERQVVIALGESLQHLSGVIQIKAVESLLSRLDGERGGVRWQAARLLNGSLRYLSKEVVPIKAVESLLPRLYDEEGFVRNLAVRVLGWRLRDLSGVIQIEAVESLLSRLNDREQNVRKQAVIELNWNLKYLSEVVQIKAVESLLSRLDGKDGYVVREQAVTVLGGSLQYLSEVVQIKAVESLLSRLDDKDGGVRERAVTVLGRSLQHLSGAIQIKAVESLLSRLDDREQNVRKQAVTALGESLQHLSGVIQIKAVESLLPRLDDKDQNVRKRAVTVLGESLQYLSEVAQDRLSDVAHMKVLGILQAMLELKDGDVEKRREVAKMLSSCVCYLPNSIQVKATDVLQKAINVLQDDLEDEVIRIINRMPQIPTNYFRDEEYDHEDLSKLFREVLKLAQTMPDGMQKIAKWLIEFQRHCQEKAIVKKEGVNKEDLEKIFKIVLFETLSVTELLQLYPFVPPATPWILHCLWKQSVQSHTSLLIQENRILFYSAQGEEVVILGAENTQRLRQELLAHYQEAVTVAFPSLLVSPRPLRLDSSVLAVDISHYWTCPLSKYLFFDPVIAEDERTYEREMIQGYFSRQGALICSSPVTREMIPAKFIANRGLCDAVEDFLRHHPQHQDAQYLPIASMREAINARNVKEVRRLLALDRRYRLLDAVPEDDKRSLTQIADACPEADIAALFAAKRKERDAKKIPFSLRPRFFASAQAVVASQSGHQLASPAEEKTGIPLASSPAGDRPFQEEKTENKLGCKRRRSEDLTSSGLFRAASEDKAAVSSPLPRHGELLQHLIASFHCEQEAVYSGVVVEESVVGLAGITTSQAGAIFRRDEVMGDTLFKLRFANEAERERCVNFYKELCPGLIKGVSPDGDFTQLKMDTRLLYNELIPKLAIYHAAKVAQPMAVR